MSLLTKTNQNKQAAQQTFVFGACQQRTNRLRKQAVERVSWVCESEKFVSLQNL